MACPKSHHATFILQIFIESVLCVRLFARSWGYTGEAGYVPHYPEIRKIELARLSAFLFTPP